MPMAKAVARGIPREQVVPLVEEEEEEVVQVVEQVAQVPKRRPHCHSPWTSRRPSHASVGKEWEMVEIYII